MGLGVQSRPSPILRTAERRRSYSNHEALTDSLGILVELARGGCGCRPHQSLHGGARRAGRTATRARELPPTAKQRRLVPSPRRMGTVLTLTLIHNSEPTRL